MLKAKKGIAILTVVCILVTALGVYLLGGINREDIQAWLQRAGVWAPLIYILAYTIATILILPSTPLNLSGGAIFGTLWGTVWTSIAALVAAIVAFWFTRTIGRELIERRMSGRWDAIDAEIRQGGTFYIFAIRLLPIIPYGIVNFVAGLTSIQFKSYLLGTVLGTIPGVLPFVMMGAGIQELRSGKIVHLLTAMVLTGSLVGMSTWYRSRRCPPKSAQPLQDASKEIK